MRKDGSTFPVEASIRFLEIEGKRYHQAIIRDMTEWSWAMATIEREEERFRQIFENMQSAVAVYEPVDDGKDFVIRGFNAAAERVERISRQDLLGKSVREVFPGVEKFGLFEVFQRVSRTGGRTMFTGSRPERLLRYTTT
jgi:PAS domain-containing protein